MITRENYEIYVIDYLDGNLSDEDQKVLMDFLARNIDLKEEFDLMKDFQMPNADIIFDNKEDLKKELSEQSVDDSNIDEWCIASIENDLTDEDQIKFESEITEREEFQQIYALYKQTKLTAENIPFPDIKPWRLPNFNISPRAEDVDFWVIADLEGDLDLNQKQKWEEFKVSISNIDSIERDYLEIKLHPEAIIFTHKNALKKRKSRVRYLYPLGGIAAAAAAFYLFLNIANFKQDTYKSFNDQVAKIEHTQDKHKYVPQPTIIPPSFLEQVAISLKSYEPKQNDTGNAKKQISFPVVMKSPEYTTVSSIEPIKKRNAKIDISYEKMITTEQPVEVIMADNLMGQYIAENNNSINTNRNKLTLFKVAQKSVNAINKKMGTEMKLEAQYNATGEKKRVKFSNRLFSVTKTINK